MATNDLEVSIKITDLPAFQAFLDVLGRYMQKHANEPDIAELHDAVHTLSTYHKNPEPTLHRLPGSADLYVCEGR